ncbi:putative hydroxymethylpyrimidine transport system substrate-binding protein [Modicisalibacter ilicicola DSM 19980]|uniref:Putative hydroxymethylpyrimidine transport system substrate-binding protein n=1 Tax=Modicisalibacter ilicicola DSM 19980 TaxID=1121942 RepID=A0A1M5E1W0_9GAMM|nr:ABC transporter substrate-binding protein [Halomonas ilicicola]SHF73185.1 putative hydroxymethylpyrimidine transport system substrate-binding protein [Halomonas ilicicola DSM 19980]
MTPGLRRISVAAVLLLLLGMVVNVLAQNAAKPPVSDAAIDASLALKRMLNDSGSDAIPTIDIPDKPTVSNREPEPLIPPPARRLRVVLDWYPTPYHAPLIVAREQDLFDRKGLEVTLTTPADPSVPPKLIAAQRAELALTSQPQLHLLVEQGLPLIRVGTLVPAPLATLLARKDNGIDGLVLLKGKTLGYAQEGPARIWLDAILEDQPIGPDDLSLRRIDFALTPSLLEGEVDAVIGAMRHVTRHQLMQQGVDAVEFLVEASDLPVYDELILVANRDVLGQHRRDIADFLDALEQATLWLVNNPERGWELVSRAEPGIDTAGNAKAWPDVLRYLALRPATLQARRYLRFETYLQGRGLIETLTPIERLAVDVSDVDSPGENGTTRDGSG